MPTSWNFVRPRRNVINAYVKALPHCTELEAETADEDVSSHLIRLNRAGGVNVWS